MAVYFLMFTAINANPISLCTLDFPRTDIRVKPKLAFKNPKNGSTSILRFPYISPVSSFDSFSLIYSFWYSYFSLLYIFLFFLSAAFVHYERTVQSGQFSLSYTLNVLLKPYLSVRLDSHI